MKLRAWIVTSVILLLGRAQAADQGLFFGAGGTVEVPLALPKDSEPFGISFRFKAMALGAQPIRLASQWSDDPKAEDRGLFHFDLTPPNRIAFTMRNAEGALEMVSGKGAGDVEQWHHAAAVWDGRELTLYFDGKAVGSKPLAGVHRAAGSALPLVVGTVPPKGVTKTVGFKGFVADVAVWSGARTAESIAEEAAKGTPDKAPGLLAHLPLREPEPVEVVKCKASGAEAKLAASLARCGWCVTPMWDSPPAKQPPLHLFGYDLSAPARTKAGHEEAQPQFLNASRQVLLFDAKSSKLGVLWQEKLPGAVCLTWIDADFKGHETIRLKSLEDGILAAATADPMGNVYYLEIQKTPANRDEATPLRAIMHAATRDGKPLYEKPLDVSNGKNCFNIWGYGGRWHASMAYQNGTLGLILPRTMYKSGDGLNHQGAIGVVFSARDPATYKNFGQLTGHSFGNLLSVNSRGEFLGIDLGDCYPRGVHLHKFTPVEKKSRVVFTFKTAHATSPKNNSPVYDEISRDGKTFYKWSNDNNTYTELGGAIEGRASYSVIFATDRSTEGRVLDNSRAFGKCDDPRDLAMVRIIKDFEKAPATSCEVSDLILAGGLPPGTRTETGGFFNFGGNWSTQRVAGVIWLTNHKTGESAHSPQLAKLRDGNVLILWEKTGPDGPSVCAIKVAETGKILGEWTCPGLETHFSREDPVLVLGDRVFLLGTEKATGKTRLCFVFDDLFQPGKPAKATKGNG